MGGGGAIRKPINPGVDVYSDFRKTSEGGGGANLKQSRYRLL